MITMALIFLAIAISSAVLGTYATTEQGVMQILFWAAIVNLGVAGGFLLGYMGIRRYSD